MSSESGKGKWVAVSLQGVPDAAGRALEAAGVTPDECRVCLESSLLPSGNFGSAWIALTPSSLAVVTGATTSNGSEPPTDTSYREAHSIAFGQLSGARAVPVAGGGALLVDIEGVPTEVLRFDSGHAGVFGGLAKRLDDAVGNEHQGPDSGTPDHRTPMGPEEAGAPATEGAQIDPLDFTELLEKWREVLCPTCGRRLPGTTQVCPACLKRTSTILRVLSFIGPIARSSSA